MSAGKHFINDVSDPIERALRGFLVQNHDLRLLEAEKVIFRSRSGHPPKVILLSGGGSGHEPAHAGYLGEGMLDIVVAGNIFASPSASQVFAGLYALDTSSGVLMIVKNYTGDKLNFGLAAEKAKAKGLDVRIIFVGDDVSVEGNDLVGKRGLAGTVFVHKLAGAAAAEGKDLNEVTRVAQLTADSVATIGVSLDRCSVPQRDAPQRLPYDEIEFGMGIHNEPGARRTSILSLNKTVSTVVDDLLNSNSKWNSTLKPKFAVMINNLGVSSALVNRIIHAVADAIQKDEPIITEYDTLAGDGDCGETLLNGITALVREYTSIQSKTVDLAFTFQQVASVIENSMGGTSGAIYAIFFNAVSNFVSSSNFVSDKNHELSSVVVKALQYGLNELCRYTTARKGHRTLMDALIPFVDSLALDQDLKKAYKAAVEGAERTKRLAALLGRASYVGKERLENEGGIPDPGALGVVSMIRGIVEGIYDKSISELSK